MMFIIFFYSSNLRAELIAIKSMRPINNADDVLFYGLSMKFYLPVEIKDFWPDRNSEQAWTGDEKDFSYWFAIADLVWATGGNYSMVANRGLPEGAIEELVDFRSNTIHHG